MKVTETEFVYKVKIIHQDDQDPIDVVEEVYANMKNEIGYTSNEDNQIRVKGVLLDRQKMLGTKDEAISVN